MSMYLQEISLEKMAWKFIVLYVSYQSRNQRKSFRGTCTSSPTVGGAVGGAVGGRRYQCT